MRGAGDVVLSLLEAWAARQTTVEPSRLMLGDCFDRMREISDGSVDMVLCDLPYGTTQNKWDTVLPLDRLWAEYWRVCRGAVVLTASQPFTSTLTLSQVRFFRHEWQWIKNRGSNFANTVREPFKEHEAVLVFAKSKWTYNKQMQERTGGGLDRANYDCTFGGSSTNYRVFEVRKGNKLTKNRVPSSWQKFNTEVGLHPTQKPVPLFEYLVRTYTDVGATVLDNCMGSGTAGVACANSGRRFVGIERDEGYFAVAERRIREAEGAARERGGVVA